MKLRSIILLALLPLVGCHKVADEAALAPVSLKQAAFHVFSTDCLVGDGGPIYVRDSRMVGEAGDEIFPIASEIVGTEESSAWVIGSASNFMSRRELNPEFLDAIRAVRDSEKFTGQSGSYYGVFRYFSIHGDPTDLDWMKLSIHRLDESPQLFVQDLITQLESRLSEISNEPNQSPQTRTTSGPV